MANGLGFGELQLPSFFLEAGGRLAATGVDSFLRTVWVGATLKKQYLDQRHLANPKVLPGFDHAQRH